MTDDREIAKRVKSAERAQSEEKCDKTGSNHSLTHIDGTNSMRTLGSDAQHQTPVVFDKTIYFDMQHPKWSNQRSRAAYFAKHGTVPAKRDPYQRRNYLGKFSRFGKVGPYGNSSRNRSNNSRSSKSSDEIVLERIPVMYRKNKDSVIRAEREPWKIKKSNNFLQ